MSEQVPKSWEVCKLEERLYRPLAYGVLKPDSYVEDGVPMLRIQDVSVSGLNKRKLHRISEKLHQEFKRTELREGDLVMSLVGTIGRVLEITKNLEGANVSRAFGVIGLKDDIDRNYVRQFLTSQKIQDWIQDQAQGNAQKVLNLGELRNLSIIYPPLPEQRKIASILTSVDEVIEKTQSQIDKLQDLKKGTMNELLTKGIGHTEFKDSELGRIPKSWEVKRLGEVGRFSKGKGISKKDIVTRGVPCIRYAEIYTEYDFVIKKFKSFIHPNERSNSKKIQKNDIIFAGSGETVEDIGKSVAFVSDIEAFVGGDAILLSPSNEIDSVFLSYQLNDGIRRMQLRKLGQGSSVIHIYSSGLEEIVVSLPPIFEQTKIASIISSVEEKIEQLESKLQQTQSLKKSLMQDLLTGKVRVSVN
jgi:type I restriction enzyme, S subunit